MEAEHIIWIKTHIFIICYRLITYIISLISAFQCRVMSYSSLQCVYFSCRRVRFNFRWQIFRFSISSGSAAGWCRRITRYSRLQYDHLIKRQPCNTQSIKGVVFPLQPFHFISLSLRNLFQIIIIIIFHIGYSECNKTVWTYDYYVTLIIANQRQDI